MIVAKTMSSIIFADTDLMWEIPSKWTLEEAATIPVVYGTVRFSLLYIILNKIPYFEEFVLLKGLVCTFALWKYAKRRIDFNSCWQWWCRSGRHQCMFILRMCYLHHSWYSRETRLYQENFPICKYGSVRKIIRFSGQIISTIL